MNTLPPALDLPSRLEDRRQPARERELDRARNLAAARGMIEAACSQIAKASAP